MSRVVIEDEAWRRILADERLRRARSGLSFHEIRLIVQHVRDSGGGAERGDPSGAPAEGPQSGGEAASPTTRSETPNG